MSWRLRYGSGTRVNTTATRVTVGVRRPLQISQQPKMVGSISADVRTSKDQFCSKHFHAPGTEDVVEPSVRHVSPVQVQGIACAPHPFQFKKATAGWLMTTNAYGYTL